MIRRSWRRRRTLTDWSPPSSATTANCWPACRRTTRKWASGRRPVTGRPLRRSMRAGGPSAARLRSFRCAPCCTARCGFPQGSRSRPLWPTAPGPLPSRGGHAMFMRWCSPPGLRRTGRWAVSPRRGRAGPGQGQHGPRARLDGRRPSAVRRRRPGCRLEPPLSRAVPLAGSGGRRRCRFECLVVAGAQALAAAPEEQPGWRDGAWRSTAPGMDVRARLPDGRVIHAIERRTPDGGMVSVVRDVTLAERELTRAKAAAEPRTARMRSWLR